MTPNIPKSATNSQITVNHKSVTVHVPDIFGAMKIFAPMTVEDFKHKFYKDKK